MTHPKMPLCLPLDFYVSEEEVKPFKILNGLPAFPQAPLVLSEHRQAELEPYLPPARNCFLREDAMPLFSNPDENLDNSGQPIIAGEHIPKEEFRPKNALPWVTITYAQSLDGHIALIPGTQTAISGPETKAMTHYLRSRHDAILVGVGTTQADNPSLNCRFSHDGVNIAPLAYQPRPLILDPSRRLKEKECTNVFEKAANGLGRAPWWIVSESQPPNAPQPSGEVIDDTNRLLVFQKAGGRQLKAGSYLMANDGVDWEAILAGLAECGVRSVMVEGGGMVINDLLRYKNHRFIDNLIVTIAPIYMGSGGVQVNPMRTFRHHQEVNMSSKQWFNYGEDMVLACRPSQKIRHVYEPDVKEEMTRRFKRPSDEPITEAGPSTNIRSLGASVNERGASPKIQVTPSVHTSRADAGNNSLASGNEVGETAVSEVAEVGDGSTYVRRANNLDSLPALAGLNISESGANEDTTTTHNSKRSNVSAITTALRSIGGSQNLPDVPANESGTK